MGRNAKVGDAGRGWGWCFLGTPEQELVEGKILKMQQKEKGVKQSKLQRRWQRGVCAASLAPEEEMVASLRPVPTEGSPGGQKELTSTRIPASQAPRTGAGA